MSDYAAPLDDIRFVLNELVDSQAPQDAEGEHAVSQDVVDAVLSEAARFASGVLAPLNVVGDRVGARMVDGKVRMPLGFREAYGLYVEGGWGGLGAPIAHGGQALPHVVTAAVGEMWKAANLAFSANFLLTTGAVEALAQHGSRAQQAKYLPRLVSGEWGGVMNLTEPQAGSDLSAIRTRAVPQADGSYRLYGQKCFITYADHDMVDNIVHLVLARLPDAPSGVKGISMFVVSQHLIREDGSLGERNDVHVTAIEKKLGQHASPTCAVQHGETGGAVAEIVGEPGAGLNYIFVMVNAARLGVALEGLGIAERALQQAQAYAQTRLQGRVPGASESVPIARHPDVRRMLQTMRAQTEAMRAAALVVAGWLDTAKNDPDAAKRLQFQGLVDLMIPVLKGWMTETGAEVASTGIQIHGGAGYVEETGAAQHLRDIRVAAIYEGTTGIQAADLVGRKILRTPGVGTLDELQRKMATILPALHALAGDPGIPPIHAAMKEALRALETASGALVEAARKDLQLALEVSVPYLKMLGIVMGGWQLARAAVVVLARPKGSSVFSEFAREKVHTARHYALHVLPSAVALGLTVSRVLAQTR